MPAEQRAGSDRRHAWRDRIGSAHAADREDGVGVRAEVDQSERRIENIRPVIKIDDHLIIIECIQHSYRESSVNFKQLEERLNALSRYFGCMSYRS
jgi:hypothetical protein